MVDNVRRECIMSMYEIYPLSRKLVFDTFDKKKYDITRTQQIIMLSLCIEGTLTMSQLASKINTSNEQATRAVAQLVDKGFVIRMQNPDNRRVINIRLTDEAMRFMEKMKNEILDDILGKFSSVSDIRRSQNGIAGQEENPASRILFYFGKKGGRTCIRRNQLFPKAEALTAKAV